MKAPLNPSLQPTRYVLRLFSKDISLKNGRRMADLTIQEAYLAMYSFLEHEYLLTNSDDIGGLLDSMSLVHDGGTAVPATWEQWGDVIEKVKSGHVDASLNPGRSCSATERRLMVAIYALVKFSCFLQHHDGQHHVDNDFDTSGFAAI